jgi:hypothetical protein
MGQGHIVQMEGGGMKNAYRSLSANLKGRDYSGDLDVDVVLK